MTGSLSSDIIDCVFTSLPDLATLLSTVLVCKSFHDVFQARPSSILTSVAKTQIGPELLPCAVRLATFDRGRYLKSRADYVQDFPSEEKFSHDEARVVTQHVAALVKNDSVVTELELFLSTTYKDRASGSRSLLNSRESLHFRRAFYRWWLMINLFPARYLRQARKTGENVDGEGSGTDEEDNSDTDDHRADEEAPDLYIRKSQHLREAFLREFSDDEVAEMWQVHNFMAFVSCYVRCAIPDPTIHQHILLWIPSIIAEVLRALRFFKVPKVRLPEQIIWDYPYADLNWPGFRVYLREKDYDTSKVRTVGHAWDKNMSMILDSGVENTEECDVCHVPHLGLEMWSSSNWHLLPCAITPHEVLDNLPGYLGSNLQETQPLSATSPEHIAFVNRHVSPGTPDWSEGKLMCKPCVLRSMGRRILNTLRELKAQHGAQLEDCCYGFNCGSQRKREHSVKLNHLCDPARVD